ncbi:hypothetical protein [Streptomyces sp. NBC_01803]|uniref:hypothetical protein n=1 Tax=Streptomyces sp. NBC_01803 TaxID=2975946 RepID=UPI002DD9ABE6|nr:hypothetical protein [Streptomyces sp. NBC_01803]WSA44526.1 hypothetical protein OIE51_10100 [Streptomyces sp. NBC_01803]
MNSRRTCTLGALGAVGAMGVALVGASPAAAQPIAIVPCSTSALVAAIETANDEGGGELLLAAGCTYTLTDDNEDSGNGLPVITSDITLLGAGTTIARSPSADDFRILQVAPEGELILSALTIKGGSTEGDGGGILNEGDLTLNATQVSSNTAGWGGGIANYGDLVIDVGSRVTANSAEYAGGGVASTGTVKVRASSIDHNSVTGTDALGGGLFNEYGVVLVEVSGIGSNSALGDGGSGAGLATVGGSVDLTLSTVESNHADTAPGGISNDGGDVGLLLSPVFGNDPTNCAGSPDPVPNCLN